MFVFLFKLKPKIQKKNNKETIEIFERIEINSKFVCEKNQQNGKKKQQK